MRSSFSGAAALSLGFVVTAVVVAAASGCAALGGPKLGELPEPARWRPTPEQVAENPCRFGDLPRCTLRCERRDATSCNAVGVLLEFAREDGADAARAAPYYRRACDDEYAPACNNLAWLYALGRGVPRDPPRSLQLFARAYDGFRVACGRGDTSGCIEAAEMLLEGRGAEMDERLALHLFERACSGGAARGCEQAALLR